MTRTETRRYYEWLQWAMAGCRCSSEDRVEAAISGAFRALFAGQNPPRDTANNGTPATKTMEAEPRQIRDLNNPFNGAIHLSEVDTHSLCRPSALRSVPGREAQ